MASGVEYNKIQQNQNLPIHEDVDDANLSRLISRKPPTGTAIAAIDEEFSLIGTWQQEWSAKQNISIPCITHEPPGFHLPRKSWSALNRVRTEHGRCAYAMHKWGKAPTPFCECGAIQTVRRIVEEFPGTAYSGKPEDLNSLNVYL
ncbi:hypothetical protein AAG570_010768 [Ranatra chinensis]|uniref:Uncharacterized protein n=1 Tax=Ranatra chinensis TaxID=642074 RepID=A0ABD0YP15_9HEMI